MRKSGPLGASLSSVVMLVWASGNLGFSGQTLWTHNSWCKKNAWWSQISLNLL